MNTKHSYLLVGLAVAGTLLFFSGFGGGILFLLWPLACMAMMVSMMWSMGSMGHSSAASREHTHEDGLTHSHT